MNPQSIHSASNAISRPGMLRRFLTPASDSLWETLVSRRTHRWSSLWNVVWVAWFFGDAVFTGQIGPGWIPAVAASFPVLVVLLALAYVRPFREAAWYAVAMVALGCAIMPIVHFGSGTCLIYGCVFLALQPNARRLLVRVVPMLVVWSVETWLLHWPWQPVIWVTLIAVCAAVGQYSMWTGWRRNAEMRLSRDEVRRLAASAERERIGRDLHDLLGHTLSMVALKSELASRLIERDPVAARREMVEVARVSRDALAQVRSAVSGIRAAALASELASARLLLETAGVHMDYWSDGKALPPAIETCLAMVLREAVTNIQRHAAAHRVEVSVLAGAERVVLRIRDDGRGGVGARGNGLTGMRERIAERGGELWIESPSGKGTGIEVRLPLPPEPSRSARKVDRVVSFPVPAPSQQAGG
ncbi:MAG TPA: sensor histidine kinase, partial [Rhodanobacteraceae bacterium]